MPKFKRGDKVIHTCGSSEMEAEFIAYVYPIRNKEQRVKVKYTSGQRNGCGDWLEKYCVHRSPISVNKHDWIKHPFGPEESKNYLPITEEKSFNPGKCVATMHKMDFKKAEDRICAQMVDNFYNSSNPRREGKASMLEWIYDFKIPAHKTITGRTVHSVLDDARDFGLPKSKLGDELKSWSELIASDDKQHDDFNDAAAYGMAYMAIDWAEGFNPNLENKMKNTISELYVDGVLTQTLINGNNLDDMHASQMLNIINSTETSLEKLNKHDQSQSEYIKQEIVRLTKFVKSVYILLDSKFATSE